MRASRQGAGIPQLPVSRLLGHEGPIQDVRFSADGNYCLTAGQDRTVRLYNPSRIDPAYPSCADGTRASVGTEVALDAIPRALPIQVYSDGYTHPVSAISLDDKSSTLVAASEKTLILTDVVTKKVKRRIQGHTARINAVAVSKGCETYLSASYDATVRIWDGRSRSQEPIQTLKEAKDSVTDVHVSQSNGAAADVQQAIIRTASVDGVVRTYDLRKGQIKCDDMQAVITSMAPTHDGQCLAISCLDETIRLMEQDTGELLNTYTSRHSAGTYALQCCITADDAHIVTGSEDGRVVLYDLVRGTQVQSLKGHSRATCAIAAHPKQENTSVLITGSYDGTAVVWANESSYVRWED